jgi:bifunctional N-acetylglucosamine-1-phosphate-uridyltransferase/glucosamine-1-phosphate-acetyltransferase GlmU-like protein
MTITTTGVTSSSLTAVGNVVSQTNFVGNGYYLTDIIKIIRNESDNPIETYLIEDSLKYQIMGVNTQEELRELESMELGSTTTSLK